MSRSRSDTNRKRTGWHYVRKRRDQQRSGDLALFDRLRDVRIEDFHFGVLDAKSGSKWINSEKIRGRQNVSRIITVPGPGDVEKTNPDGEVLRGAALLSAPTLYITLDGGQVEAKTACQRFIDLVQSLVDRLSPA